ncbi:predicted protein [Sclerotinia sclerotiorum 1980 UF-70]|uniref:Uncharacterized protein n=1 Tax=Sclerotinia sclerotiorum (strain ATCC 18683 / 1980 / Ss-1) TaxID=665079 RepID=A7F3N0_SCLS1|nr:predicted protein [Sclerotinia sclerotiorum 1980 UF-70]EDN97351.1 predicted protein [Sclerotinia sclerotiorum 1980 UF-70]
MSKIIFEVQVRSKKRKRQQREKDLVQITKTDFPNIPSSSFYWLYWTSWSFYIRLPRKKGNNNSEGWREYDGIKDSFKYNIELTDAQNRGGFHNRGYHFLGINIQATREHVTHSKQLLLADREPLIMATKGHPNSFTMRVLRIPRFLRCFAYQDLSHCELLILGAFHEHLKPVFSIEKCLGQGTIPWVSETKQFPAMMEKLFHSHQPAQSSRSYETDTRTTFLGTEHKILVRLSSASRGKLYNDYRESEINPYLLGI